MGISHWIVAMKTPPLFRTRSGRRLFQRLTPEEQVFAIKCMVISATEH